MWIDNFCAAEFMSHRVGIHYFRLSSMSESYLYRSMDPLKDRGVGNILVCRLHPTQVYYVSNYRREHSGRMLFYVAP